MTPLRPGPIAPRTEVVRHRLRGGLDLRAPRLVTATGVGALVAPPAGLSVAPGAFVELFEPDVGVAPPTAAELQEELAEAGRGLLLLQRIVDELREQLRVAGVADRGPLVVGLDCDGVVSDYVGAAEAWLRRKFRARLRDWRYSPDEWDLRADLPLDIAAALTEASKAKGFCARLSECPGAADGVPALRELCDLHVVTAAWPESLTWAGERAAWLEQRWPGLPVTFTAHKEVFAGHVLVDDKYTTLVKWKARHPCGVAILWRAAWNRPYWYTTEETHPEMSREAIEKTHDVLGPEYPQLRGRRDPAIEVCDGFPALVERVRTLAAGRVS